MEIVFFGLSAHVGWNPLRDFCGIELWAVMDSAGFCATCFTDNILLLLILCLVQATVYY